MIIEVKISKKRIPYKMAMLYLNKRVEEVKNGTNKELLWILEHPTTYTAGVSFNKKEIIDKKIKIVKSNRGGKITLHNPGQKIVYFVIDLNKRKKDIRKLINSIEKSIIQFLENYKSLHSWLYGIGFPKNRQQFSDFRGSESVTPIATQGASNDIGDVKPATASRGMFGDATLTILSNKNNPIVEVRFKDIYPASLTGLNYSQVQTDVEYLTASSDFKYTLYEIITL